MKRYWILGYYFGYNATMNDIFITSLDHVPSMNSKDLREICNEIVKQQEFNRIEIIDTHTGEWTLITYNWETTPRYFDKGQLKDKV